MNQINTGLAVGALLLLAAPVAAQAPYPNKPIRLIVPIAAGGPSDAAARALAKGLTAGLGQEVLVDNRPGANAGLGAAAVLNAAPDGYTLLFAPGGQRRSAAPEQGFAVQVDHRVLAGVDDRRQHAVPGRSGQRAGQDTGRVRRPCQGQRAAAACAVPTRRPRTWWPAQVTGALGFTLERVPYKGAAQLLPDLLEGRVQAAVLPVGFSAPHVRSGRLTMLGCSIAERIAALPSVPTLLEAGVSAAPLITAHFVLGPPQLPPSIWT